MVRGTPSWRIADMRPICRFGLSFSSPSEAHQLVKGPQILLSISISGSYLIQPRSFCTRMTVLLTLRYTPAQSDVRVVPCNLTRALATTELSMTTSSNSANAYGAQMAKYFTMNQPPHVSIDSAVSIVRPQLAITRLVARSGIPERTASIPSEKAYVVSVHLNHANSGEWELWTDEKYAKTGAWPVGGVAMCDLESNTSIRNPGPIDWVHYHVPRATLDSLTDDAGMRQVKRLHCVYGTPDPVLHHLTQAILPCLNKPEIFSQLFIDSFTMTVCSHLVGRYGQLREPTLQLKGGLAPWQMRRAVELLREHLDGELKLETLAAECRLSVSHFARSFRTSFGTSPHHYLTLRRV